MKATLPLLLLIACGESPFAPPPEEMPCGTSDHPCPFTCELACASSVIGMTTGCMQTLEGAFDADRRRCDFPDGSHVDFSWPVPAPGSDLDARTWNLKLVRDGRSCLTLNVEPLPWVGGGLHSRSCDRLCGTGRSGWIGL